MKETHVRTTLDETFQDSCDPRGLCVETIIETKDINFHGMSRHCRSKSAPDEKAAFANWDASLKALKEDLKSLGNQKDVGRVSKRNKHDTSKKDRLISLEQDVKHLQTKWEGQKATKGILEQALARASSVLIPVDGNYISQHTHSLIKDIALLELEVVQLEQHLLSLYRKAFEVKVKDQSCVSKILNKEEVSPCQNSQSYQLETPKAAKKYLSANFQTKSGSLVSKNLNTFIGNRSFNESKVDQIESGCNVPGKGKPSLSYSQPISFSRKEAKGSPSAVTCELWREVISAEANAAPNLSEAFPGGQVSETPNKLSEELVRCMAAIYCKLADPPIPYLGGTISPSSSSSSASTLSSKELSSDGWSPHWRTDASCTMSPTNTRLRKNVAENTSPYTSMVAVCWISVDNDRLHYAEKMLQNFRYLVQGLERLNPGKLKHEEKLAFWINIYNALMMHAYLAYGIPRNHIKRVSLLQKASYKIGAHSINAHTIEHSLLGCRSHRPAHWIQALLSPVSKLRGAHRQAYALDKPEPLACFAICCGGQSDPAVRVYTAKNVYHELDAAKRDFLQANVTIQKDNKVLVPQVLESFAKESSMGSLGLLEWICQNVTENQRRDLKTCMNMKPYRCIEWTPYNFNFRYLFVRDLARWFPPNSS